MSFPSLEIQERTVGSGKTAAKVFKNGREIPGMLLLTNQFHDSFECLSIVEASIYRTAFVIFLYDGVTYKLFLSFFYAYPSELRSKFWTSPIGSECNM